jgi:hypothetical protein
MSEQAQSSQTQTNGTQTPYEGLPPDGAELRGHICSVGPLEEVGDKKTPFRSVVFKVDEDGPWKGRGFSWTAWFTDAAMVRTYEVFLQSGCTFANGEDDFVPGLGTKEQVAVMEREEPFTPEKTAENPNPRTIYRVRVKFINRGVQGMRGEAVSDGRKAVLKPTFQSALQKARTGDRSTGPDAQGNAVGKDGQLRDASGRVKF